MTEMEKLCEMLEERGIDFELRSLHGGPQIMCPCTDNKVIDAVCHWGSYGGSQGLLEILSNYEKDVVGWLTADEAIKYFEEAWEKIEEGEDD